MQASSLPTSVIRRLDDFQEKRFVEPTENENCVFHPACDRFIVTCQVCGDEKISKYKIYGATAAVCNACRVFFSRAAGYKLTCKCEGGAKALNSYTRRDCRSCRYQKCISAGMSHGQEKRKSINGKNNGRKEVSSRMILSDTERQRITVIVPTTGHAIGPMRDPVLSFTIEEEFKVIECIVRIEEYQNRLFDYLCCKFPQYLSVHAQMIKQKGDGMRITYNSYIDYMILNIGLEFSKQMCGTFYEEMSALTTDVLSEMLNCKFPAIYVLFFSILEGNTRERTWIDQIRKSVHVSKECHRIMKNSTFFEHLQHVPPLSVMDVERYLTMTADNKDKFSMMVSRVGRLLRDDLQLQALYHMVVLLTPTSHNSLETQQNKSLQNVRNGAVQLMYRYLSTDPNIHYYKTVEDSVENSGNSVYEERSEIIRMSSSEGLENLNATKKTELLLKLVDDIHYVADIMANRKFVAVPVPHTVPNSEMHV